VIARNRVIPARATINVSTAQDNQSSVSILVYEGERPSPDGNHLVGCLTLEGIPPAPAGEPAVEVSLDIDTDGLLHVTVEQKASNASVRAVMANDVDRLTEEQIEVLIKDSERLWEEDKPAREEIATPRATEGAVTTFLLAPAGSDDGVGERCAALEAARAEAAPRRTGAGFPGPAVERFGHLSSAMLKSISEEL
jgi:molecular chaperone DnaK (HSP70)